MCLMKNLIKSMALLAVAAMGLSACNEQNLTPEQVGKGELVTVHFGANSSIESPTKATLTTQDEKTFKSAWEDGDVLSVEYSNDGATNATGKVEAKWVDTTSSFDTTLPEYTGTWTYDAVYPAPNAKGEVDFGSARVQNGNAYNSKYDLMFGEAVAENAPAGKTDDGKDVIFNMDRQTGIVYFHLTSALDEEVVSATLSVSEPIASSLVMPNNEYSKGFDISLVDLKDITITFAEGTAPKASDFKLWFNVIPTPYETMSLHVETTGHTLDISRSAKGGMEEFVAGKLYKTVATVPDTKWVAKAVSVEKWVKVTDASTLAAGDELIMVSDTLAAGDIEGENVYLSDVKIVVNEDESVTIGSDVLVFTLGGVEGGWTLSNNDGIMLGATAVKKLAWGSGTTTWLISIDETGDAIIQNTHMSNNSYDFGRFLYNVNYTRFTTYKSDPDKGMLLPSLYRLESSTPKTALDTPVNLSVSAAKVVSWDAVSGAASYNVTIGSETYTSETNSYDASAIEDEYYDVSVVAVPSDKDNYKNSAAATLTAVKFGTPTLATPVLKEGLVDDASVNVTWTADSRAANGYKCEIYNGETLVEAKDDVKDNAVEFTELTAETAYTVKVQAKAVESPKAYAASEIATLSVTTKAAGVQANDGTKEHPYTAAEAITVIDAGADLKDKYVKGIVAADPAPSFNSKYNSLTYYITSGGATIQIYSGRDLGDSGFVGTEDLNAGDEVVVFGILKKYNSIYEMDKENYLISINGKTEIYRGLEISGQKTNFTVGDAFEFGGKVLQVWRGKDAVDVTTTATFSGYDMSTEGTQTVTITVGAETLTYNIVVRAASAEESKTYTLQFGENYNGKSVKGYSDSWTVTCEGFTWNMTNWNNNQNGWTYVKAGPKNNSAAQAIIETNTSMPEAISTISITIDDVSNGSITSIVLKSSTTNDFTSGTVIETKKSVSKGVVKFEIPSPQKNLYYQLDFTLNNTTTTKNGVAQISKVVYTNN